MFIMKISSNFVVFISLIACATATINPSKNKKTKQKTSTEVNKVKEKIGPQETSVYDRNLVDNEPQAADILAEANTYYEDTSLKNFNGTLLGYVTPVSFSTKRN